MLSVIRQAVYQVRRRSLHEAVRRITSKALGYIGGQPSVPLEDPLVARTNARMIRPGSNPMDTLTAIVAEIGSVSRGARSLEAVAA